MHLLALTRVSATGEFCDQASFLFLLGVLCRNRRSPESRKDAQNGAESLARGSACWAPVDTHLAVRRSKIEKQAPSPLARQFCGLASSQTEAASRTGAMKPPSSSSRSDCSTIFGFADLGGELPNGQFPVHLHLRPCAGCAERPGYSGHRFVTARSLGVYQILIHRSLCFVLTCSRNCLTGRAQRLLCEDGLCSPIAQSVERRTVNP